MKYMAKKQAKTSHKNGAEAISGAMLLSHQLMSTLTAMKWSLKMLTQGDFGAMTKEQQDIVGKIDQRNDLLISLANRVLHTSKLEDEKYCCNLASVNIETIISSTMGYSKESATKKGVNLEFKRLTEKIPALRADEEMLKIAVQNLFDNAIKYTPAGGKVTVFLDSDGKNVEFKIQDSGIGVPEKQKGRLFHKFFRADNAIKLNPVGSGLGLFISKNIIGAHGGKMGFDSKENKGSAFYFSLPVNG